MTSAPPVVVDTSVAVKWFFDEPYSAQALTLLHAFREGTVRPLAPDLIYPEFANAAWKRVARDRLTPEDGVATNCNLSWAALRDHLERFPPRAGLPPRGGAPAECIRRPAPCPGA